MTVEVRGSVARVRADDAQVGMFGGSVVHQLESESLGERVGACTGPGGRVRHGRVGVDEHGALGRVKEESL